MIEQQIRPWEVLDPQVLELLSVVHREDFVPLAHKALAFVDMEIPLGSAPNQVMLAPRVQARLLQDLAVKKTDKVLDIGTGSGFMAALLAHQAAHVLSLEVDADLAAQAQANLQKAGVSNVTVRNADGSQGAATDGPFDVVLLNGSVAQVPTALLQQLTVDEASTVSAASVEEARSLLQQQHFDLVVLDLGLPDGSGWELLPLIAKQHQHIPVLVWSSEQLSAEQCARVEAVLAKGLPVFSGVSRHQPVERDIAVVVADDVTHAALMAPRLLATGDWRWRENGREVGLAARHVSARRASDMQLAQAILAR